MSLSILAGRNFQLLSISPVNYSLRVVRCCCLFSSFSFDFYKTFCKQTVEALIRHRVLQCSSNIRLHYINPTKEALPWVLGNRGNRAFISGEQGKKGQILRGTGEQRQYWGTGNIR